jgi:hypothetical protein
MATKKADPTPIQPPLVPLTDAERTALPGRLATAIKKLEDLEEEHKELRAAQAAERKKLRGQISAMAGQLRSGGR